MNPKTIFQLVLLIASLTACMDSTNKSMEKTLVKQKKTFPYDQEDVVYDIINATLYQLVPKPENTQSTIYFNERLFVAEKKLIQEFIDQGSDDLLLNINRNMTVAEPINIKRIKDFGKITVLHTYPLSSKELESHVGGVIYSRIILNNEKTKASFIFYFERMHNKKSKILCAVDVIKSNGNWVISSKTCLENHPGMLSE